MSAYQAAIADFNGDGFNDVAVGGFSSNDSATVLNVLKNDGSGSFSSPLTQFLSLNYTTGLVTADFNNDTVSDLLAMESAGATSEGLVLLASTTQGTSPLQDFSLKSRAGALQALSQFDVTLRQLTLQRGAIGSAQSRLGTASRVVQTTRDTYASAQSRILDADIGEETANLARFQIIQNAATAILSHVNLQPSLALTLLNPG